MDGAGFMKKPTIIITHPGRAHRDDFLSVCWLLGNMSTDTVVLRREPTQQELDDPEVYVLDIGGHYDPHFRNFDHHQFPADQPPTCALQLLLEYDLGPREAHEIFPWLALTGLIDSKGAAVASREYQAPIELFTKLSSPIEQMITEIFSEVVRLDASDILFHTMQAIGRKLWQRGQMLGDSIRAVEVEGLALAELGLRIMIAKPESVATMPAPFYLPEVMEIKRRTMKADGFDPDISISPNVDTRGPGWVLYRYDETGRVDFNRVAGHPMVSFVHANGFICKVDKCASMNYLVELASKSVAQPATVDA